MNQRSSFWGTPNGNGAAIIAAIVVTGVVIGAILGGVIGGVTSTREEHQGNIQGIGRRPYGSGGTLLTTKLAGPTGNPTMVANPTTATVTEILYTSAVV